MHAVFPLVVDEMCQACCSSRCCKSRYFEGLTVYMLDWMCSVHAVYVEL
jgi:hypothetical protein